jgi:hypothetical protein
MPPGPVHCRNRAGARPGAKGHLLLIAPAVLLCSNHHGMANPLIFTDNLGARLQSPQPDRVFGFTPGIACQKLESGGAVPPKGLLLDVTADYTR